MNREVLNKEYYMNTFSEVCAPDSLRKSIGNIYDQSGSTCDVKRPAFFSRRKVSAACIAAAVILAVCGTVYAGANRHIYKMWEKELQESSSASSLFPNEYETLDPHKAGEAALEAITWMQKSVVIPIYEGHVNAYSNEDGTLIRTFSREECMDAEISDKGEVACIAGELYIVTLVSDEDGKTSEVRLFPAEGYKGNAPVPSPEKQTLYKINEWLSE